jgi:hypothetical protein
MNTHWLERQPDYFGEVTAQRSGTTTQQLQHRDYKI